MLPSSKSPSTVPGRRAVPFLAASRSISAWGETTASGPSAPSPTPGRGDLGPKAQSGAHGWEPVPGRSRCSRPPATPGHPARPPFTWPSRACLPQRVPCRPGLCSPWLVPASHTRPEPATPPAAAGARARARRRIPASPLALQAPAPPTRRPRRQGRARLRCRPPGRAASRPQRSTSCSPDKPTRYARLAGRRPPSGFSFRTL